MNTVMKRARMLISCPDQPGIVARVSQFLFDQGANIVHSDQHTTDPLGGLFFMRIEFDHPSLHLVRDVLEASFMPIASEFEMKWRIAYASQKKRMGIFVSKENHCLLELLWQWKAGDLTAEIPLVISNHEDLRQQVESLGISYHHIPVTPDTMEFAEQKHLQVTLGKVDFIVLARYMQMISPAFISAFPNQIINIHHSFLPAFVGGKPYLQAYQHGVKLIGATAHFVTEVLDGGPIIEQDVQRVSHKDQVEDLKRIGRHIERVVLARAVNGYLEDRILVHENKTVVFS
jgi:formyltetrahydrofolate deformylase